jgi:asparagine synthase (glutamine-hydrolysing)
VRIHMISDVPVGFLLSGGVDSTVVLSSAVKETNKRISTFTVGFAGDNVVDERPFARMAATRFGTEHHEITITPQKFWDFLPSLIWHMEEPVCDPPAVSLHYVSKLARQHVKVLLSGEGGDEAFGGYHTYRNFLLLERLKTATKPLNGCLSAIFRASGRFPCLRKIGQFAPYIDSELGDYYYSRAASPFSYFNQNKEALFEAGFRSLVSDHQSVKVIRSLFGRVQGETLLDQMQYIDIKTSLPDDLLIKADKITMGNSLELRVPFLDHLVLEFAASLPSNYRVNRLMTKRILKETFRERIPEEIIKRKKAGFPIPIERWIQVELRDQVRQILLSRKCLERGYFKKDAIVKLLALGDQGQPVAKEIFSLLTLELLHLKFIDR